MWWNKCFIDSCCTLCVQCKTIHILLYYIRDLLCTYIVYIVVAYEINSSHLEGWSQNDDSSVSCSYLLLHKNGNKECKPISTLKLCTCLSLYYMLVFFYWSRVNYEATNFWRLVIGFYAYISIGSAFFLLSSFSTRPSGSGGGRTQSCFSQSPSFRPWNDISI